MKAVLALLLGLVMEVPAMDPPDRVTPYKSFTASGRLDPALRIGNSSFAPELVERLVARVSGDKSSNHISWRGRGLPSTGSPRMLVLLIDFDEYPARPGDTPAAIKARIFGSAGEFPYESLTAYYRRASGGKLNIQGDVLGWFRAGKRADLPMNWAGREGLLKRALRSCADRDLSRYDSNGDGEIDYFAVIWTGPAGEWGTFWWGAAPIFSDPSFAVGGKKLGFYSWQGVAENWADPSSQFKIRTLIHETGHAMGLPDYYDYSKGVGPDGGLGYFDMMDSMYYDHNCFSKMMLGWVAPRVIKSAGFFTLRPAAEIGDCVMLAPQGRPGAPFSEFFLLENRQRVGNDHELYSGGGMVIWHVDARMRPDGKDFLYNNSTSEHKLLKVLEADGLEEIERAGGSFTIADFYGKGRVLGRDTTPSSRLYDGTDTGITLTSKGGDGDALFEISFR